MTKFNNLLLSASLEGNLSRIRYALENGANINARDKDQDTPLMCALMRNHLSCVDFLIQAKANIEDRDKEGKTVLMLAAHWDRTEPLKSLLTANADIYAVHPERNFTVLMCAEPNCLQVLVDEKPELINVKNKSNNTALHAAILLKKEKHAEILIKAGADINDLPEKDKEKYAKFINAVQKKKDDRKQAFNDQHQSILKTIQQNSPHQPTLKRRPRI